MNTAKYLGSLVATALVAAAALTGCMVEAGSSDAPISEAAGSISVAWTIDGRADPHVCEDFGAAAVAVEIYDQSGDLRRATRIACEDFGVTIDLEVGEFSADATLVDGFDDAVSTTATATRLVVDDDSDLMVDLDFPTNSLL